MDVRTLKSKAAGKWTGILTSCGVSEDILNKKHQPCPFCEGKDRFRYVDKAADGFWFCNQCGSGDGFDFLSNWLNVPMTDVFSRVEELTSSVSSDPPPRPGKDKREAIVNVLNTGPVKGSYEHISKYLATRGIDMGLIGKPLLKMVKGLKYYHEGDTSYLYAMLAKVENVRGELESVHRTYFGVPDDKPNRKMMSPVTTITGSAIRLYKAGSTLAVAEGIETALSARQLMLERGTDVPVWAAVSAHGLEHIDIPDSVSTVFIFGDNDDNYTGQAASYSLAQRLVREGKIVRVRIPDDRNDWNDVLREKNDE